MFRNPGNKKRGRWGLMVVLAGATTTAAPAIAHQVEIHADVGATIHIEPNDTPLAGAPSLAWFALTQKGGTVIPLAQCDCQLTVYDEAQQAIATPALSPTTAEGFQNIPSASVTFPDVGRYDLVLKGSPVSGTDFQPFELRYDVMVAGRATPATTAVPETPTAMPEAEVSPDSGTLNETTETSVGAAASVSQGGWIGGLAIAALVGILGYWQIRSRQS